MKILIGYDGTPAAVDAIVGLRDAGLPARGEAVVLSVARSAAAPSPVCFELVEVALGEATPATHDHREHGLREIGVAHTLATAEKGALLLRDLLPRWSIESEARTGDPAEEIVASAEVLVPDLVVVGSQPKTALTRALVGSVSRLVADECPVTVRVGRPRRTHAGPLRVLVASDGSPASVAAIEAAGRRTWPVDSIFRVVSVEEPVPVGVAVAGAHSLLGGWVEPPTRSRHHEVQAAAQHGTDRLRAHGLSSLWTVALGDPPREVVRLAEEWDADLLVVGCAHPHSATAVEIASRAPCSVEIVRSPAPPPGR